LKKNLKKKKKKKIKFKQKNNKGNAFFFWFENIFLFLFLFFPPFPSGFWWLLERKGGGDPPKQKKAICINFLIFKKNPKVQKNKKIGVFFPSAKKQEKPTKGCFKKKKHPFLKKIFL